MPSTSMRVFNEARYFRLKAGAANGQIDATETSTTMKSTTKPLSRRDESRESGVVRIIVTINAVIAKGVRPAISHDSGGTNWNALWRRARAIRTIKVNGKEYPSVHQGLGSRENQRPNPTPATPSKQTPKVSSQGFIGAFLIESILFQPGLRQRAEAQEPIIELSQSPPATRHQAAAQAIVFQTAQPITHRHGRLAGVPVHVGLGAGASEAQMDLQIFHRRFVAVAAGLQAQIDEDPMAAPEGVVELLHQQPG